MSFRCDMAEMVPVEFWAWAIPQVSAVNSNIIFIAEIYNPNEYRNYIQSGKFNYLYDKVQLYDTLRLLVTGHRSTNDIHPIQQSLSGINDHMLHFLENHDEQRIASRFFAGDPWKALPAMVITATIDRGPVMIYFGQEVGEPGAGDEGFQGDDGRTTIYDYLGHSGTSKMDERRHILRRVIDPRTEATATNLRRHLEPCGEESCHLPGRICGSYRVQSAGG